MATQYPGAIDDFTNPTASDTLDSATVPHADQHANANDAIEAIEGALGINPQGSYDTVAERLDDLTNAVSYVYTQGTPSDFWEIEHNLGFHPNATVVDSAGTTVEGDIAYLDLNTITLSFRSGFSGTAYLS